MLGFNRVDASIIILIVIAKEQYIVTLDGLAFVAVPTRYSYYSKGQNQHGAVNRQGTKFAVFAAARTAEDEMNKRRQKSNLETDNASDRISRSAAIAGNTKKVCLARAVAIRSLTSTRTNQTGDYAFYATTKLEEDRIFQMLELRDRSFARLLVGTVERRKGQIDQLLSNFINVQKNNKSSQRVQECLRVGVAQLIFLKTSPHAAVKETVQTLRWKQSERSQHIPESTVKFANAVLRGVARLVETKNGTSIFSSDDALLNISPWLVNEWKTSWGENITRNMADIFLEPPSHLDISCKALFVPTANNSVRYRSNQLEIVRTSLEELYNNGNNSNVSAVILPHGSIRLRNLAGSIASQPNFSIRNSSYWVQDASAAVPAMALHSALLLRNHSISSSYVVDMCAAPGGKTAQLLSMGFKKVTSIESSRRRNKRLMENLNRLGFLNHTVCIEKGQNWIPSDEAINGILLDAPCSSTGTASRNPDVLRKEQHHLESLVDTQKILLNHCIDNILNVGGILVYSTCSLLKRESEDQIDAVLQRSNERGESIVKMLPFLPGEIPGFDEAIDMNNNGWMRVLPGVLHDELRLCDGFFIARLVKVAD